MKQISLQKSCDNLGDNVEYTFHIGVWKEQAIVGWCFLLILLLEKKKKVKFLYQPDFELWPWKEINVSS